MSREQTQSPAEAHGEALAEVAAFLDGSGPLEGAWFGEPHPTKKGKYWWRENLRDALTGAHVQPKGTTLTDEQADAIADAHRWDTREGRRAMLRAVQAPAPAPEIPAWFDDPFIAEGLQALGLTPPTPREFGETIARRYLAKISRLEKALAEAQAPAVAHAGLPLTQEPKYTVNGSAIVNRASGEAIPPDEPVFIFRARDAHAMYALRDYLIRLPLGTSHRKAVEQRVMDFFDFKAAHPERMKEPDTEPASHVPVQHKENGNG